MISFHEIQKLPIFYLLQLLIFRIHSPINISKAIFIELGWKELEAKELNIRKSIFKAENILNLKIASRKHFKISRSMTSPCGLIFINLVKLSSFLFCYRDKSTHNLNSLENECYFGIILT